MASASKDDTAPLVNNDSIVNIRIARCRKHSKQRRSLLSQLLNCPQNEIAEQVNGRREQDEYKRLLYRINPIKYRCIRVCVSSVRDWVFVCMCLWAGDEMILELDDT